DPNHHQPVMMSVAQFNSEYLGNIAQEIGETLGLLHNDDYDNYSEGHSIMGRTNFYHLCYRRAGWAQDMPDHAYLSLDSALQLISHPLFTGSNRGRWDNAESTF